MQLTCPKCGETIPAEHINVQEMVAVCPNCDNIFRFELPEDKAKRRKVKQPAQLMLRDDDKLLMAYRTNFRLQQNEAFILGSIGGSMALFITVALLSKGLLGAIIPAFVALAFFYTLAATVFNRTHIEADMHNIHVARKPLPTLNQGRDVSLSGVVAIHCEETPLSKKEGYDLPRYNVWAEFADGSRKMIVTDVVDDYGYFIAQRLDEYLELGHDVDVSRLEETLQSEQQILDDVPLNYLHDSQ